MAIPFATIANVERIVQNEINKLRKQYNPFVYSKQVRDYLAVAVFNASRIDYDKANKRFMNPVPILSNGKAGACSGLVDFAKHKAIRTLDWYYNTEVAFFIGTVGYPDKGLATSIGVADCFPRFTKEIVDKGGYSAYFDYLPFDMTDGINEYGVYIQQNVVHGRSLDININPEGKTECCIIMLCRFILDHLKDIDKLEELLSDVHLYGSALSPIGYIPHFLIAQGNKHVHLELHNSEFVIIRNAPPIITNFRIEGVQFDSTTLYPIVSTITDPYGMGVERWRDAADYLTHKAGAPTTEVGIMEALFYTRAYTEFAEDGFPRWLTEYCDEDRGLTLQMAVRRSPEDLEAFREIVQEDIYKYQHRSRTDKRYETWQTNHSCIYDMTEHSGDIYCQERIEDPIHATPYASI